MRRRPSQTRVAVSLSFVGWPSCRLLAWLSLACYRWLQGHAAGSVMDGRASGLGFWIHFSLVGPLQLGWSLRASLLRLDALPRRLHARAHVSKVAPGAPSRFVRLRAPRCSGHPRSWMPRLDATVGCSALRRLHACARVCTCDGSHQWSPAQLDAAVGCSASAVARVCTCVGAAFLSSGAPRDLLRYGF